MKKILSASEMKQIRGGAVSSSVCASGERLYTCVTIWEGGNSSSGAVCAESSAMARTSINLNYYDQGVKDDVSNIRCV